MTYRKAPATPLDIDQHTRLRRRALGGLGTLGVLALASCGGGGGGSESSGGSDGSGTGSTGGTTVSTVSTLSELVVSSGTLSPAFSSSTTAYTLNVANSITSLTVTPTADVAAATISVNGSLVASGAASAAIALQVGTTAVTIIVKAEDGVSSTSYTVAVTRATQGSCTLTAKETEGPYPLLAILGNSSMVRSNITEGKTGVPLTVTLTLQDASNGCAAVQGAAIYIWHCDKDGLYSGYDIQNNRGQTGLTYTRGIQVTDSNGQVRFTTIYPGWYEGRITHIHAQVYLNNNLQVSATATTQLAFPQEVTKAVYSTALYTHGQNTSVSSFAQDNVFSDGTGTELVTITGNTDTGYEASLTIVIA